MNQDASSSEKPLQWLTARWAEYSLGLLAIVSATFLANHGDQLFDTATNILGKRLLIQIVSFLFFSSVILLVLFVRARKKRGVFSRLKPVPGIGYEIDTLTGEAVCPRCTTDDRAMPMRDVGNNYFCWSCNQGIIK